MSRRRRITDLAIGIALAVGVVGTLADKATSGWEYHGVGASAVSVAVGYHNDVNNSTSTPIDNSYHYSTPGGKRTVVLAVQACCTGWCVAPFPIVGVALQVTATVHHVGGGSRTFNGAVHHCCTACCKRILTMSEATPGSWGQGEAGDVSYVSTSVMAWCICCDGNGWAESSIDVHTDTRDLGETE